VASTRSRPRGREHARPTTGGVAAEHATKIYTIAIVGIVVIIAFLALTSIGHVIDAATQHFMLFYAGVFALIGLCASVGLGLVATDRMFLHPGHRVFIQSAHRAASFGAVAFLIIHIITEILAQRVHVIDAVIPFLSPFRTFYIGLGTIASDLIILLAITGIMRGRFNESGKAWRWRAIHYTSYAALVFGVWHGLLGGRPGKPYVDWSYGLIIAFVALGVAVRVFSNSLRPKESLSAPPVDQSATSASAPLRAAALLAQYGASRGGRASFLGAGTGAQPMLSAPVGTPVLTALPAGTDQQNPGQPYYEPGYEGPPRYLGAPRSTGPMPQANTGPMPRANTGAMPLAGTGPMPRANTGSMPRANTGSMPRANTGSMPRANTGSMPRANTGSMPRVDTGPYPAVDPRSQSWPGTGPVPQAGTGPQSRPPTGPMPRVGDGRGDWGTGPQPRPATGPMPQAGTGPRQRPATGPVPGAGQRPGTGTGPRRRPDTGSMPALGPDDGGWQGRSPWPAADYDGGYDGGYVDTPWDGELPEADPDFRYREPGPGMPGYRGSRDHRYGGDRY
jgi:DMSO/TMAO reductase YedYZ heme-binding membrane subunit